MNNFDDFNEPPKYEYQRVQLGQYPQGLVTNALVEKLNNLVQLPTVSKNGWQAYRYFANGKAVQCGWYRDVCLDGQKFRAVYFQGYRVYNTMGCVPSNQKKSGYTPKTIYWFLWEPIVWQALPTDDGTILLSEKILDAMELYPYDEEREIDGQKVFPSSYPHSTLRMWLNTTFFQFVFSAEEADRILPVTVVCDIDTTPQRGFYGPSENLVWLFGESDVKKFFPNRFADGRIKQGTDYAKSQGLYVMTRLEDYQNNSPWRLRTPSYHYTNCSFAVDSMGLVDLNCGTGEVSHGLVPAIKIKL